MEMLMWIGVHALWFVINTLATMYIAVIGGIGLAAGFHMFKTWQSKRREKENEKQANVAMDEVEEAVAAGAATNG